MMQFYELMHRPKNKAMVKSLLTVRWEEGKIVMIDQTKLPTRLVYVEYDKYEDVARAIKPLSGCVLQRSKVKRGIIKICF
jgi:hypothetical protein